MLISGNIPSLLNGVSQQAPSMRLPSQGEEMVNFFPSVVDGLVKRPPTKHIARLTLDGIIPVDTKAHLINRDLDNQYILMIADDGLHVFDLEGKPKYLYGENYAWDYLSHGYVGNTSHLSALSIADYTFILNNKYPVKKESYFTPAGTKGVLVYVKQVSYQTDYSLRITYKGKKYTVGYTTPANVGTVDDPPPHISTGVVAAYLYGTTDKDGTHGLQYSGLAEDGLLGITKPSNISQPPFFLITIRDGGSISDLDVAVNDSRGGTEIFCVKTRIQKFSDLPRIGVEGMVIEIVGEKASSADNYYVKFESSGASAIGEGTWVETVKPGIERGIDRYTMPMALVRDKYGGFKFDAVNWGERTVGDEDSSPMPEFVGNDANDRTRTIHNMFLYRNRIGFLSADTVSMSAASDYFRFFPETAMTIVDADPISLAAGLQTVTDLRWAVPFNEELLIFADQAQFILNSPDVFSAATASLKVTTAFNTYNKVAPVNAGKTVFFLVSGTQYQGVKEYYVESDGTTKDAANITSHVPQYLEAPIREMAVSTSADVLLLLPEKQRDRLFMYKYYWNGGEKLQASWSILEFPGAKIFNIVFLNSILYMVVQRGNAMYLEKIDFSETNFASVKTPTSAQKRFVYLDRLTTIKASSYNGETNTTTWTSPYTEVSQPLTLVDSETLVSIGTFSPGEPIAVKGNYLERICYIGVEYDSRYTFSEQFLRTDNGGGVISTQQGRLQYRRWSLIHGESGYFKVTVKHEGGQAFEYPFTRGFIGGPDIVTDKMLPTKGKFTFPVKGRSDRTTITVTNDTYMPTSIISAEWEAFYTTRDRRAG